MSDVALGFEVHCNKPNCGKTWPRDPALEVACPHCHAPVGHPCKRPSGHRVWGGEPHPERDILADKEGHYGECPFGCCGLGNNKPEGVDPRQDDLFGAAA